MTVADEKIAEPHPRLWTREEFYELAEEGYFRGQRVMLLEGEIIQMPPHGRAHATAITFVTRWLTNTFGDGYLVRVQLPLNLPNSDPEPDAAVIASSPVREFDHPQTAVLVVEVSDSSLKWDHRKAGLYAAVNVTEYWILDLKARAMEVYRSPDPRASVYREHQVLTGDQSIAPVSAPDKFVKVSEFLPD